MLGREEKSVVEHWFVSVALPGPSLKAESSLCYILAPLPSDSSLVRPSTSARPSASGASAFAHTLPFLSLHFGLTHLLLGFEDDQEADVIRLNYYCSFVVLPLGSMFSFSLDTCHHRQDLSITLVASIGTGHTSGTHT